MINYFIKDGNESMYKYNMYINYLFILSYRKK